MSSADVSALKAAVAAGDLGKAASLLASLKARAGAVEGVRRAQRR